MRLLPLTFLGLVILWVAPLEAACINNGNGSWTVSALNSTEMNACIQAAASGNTINVPPGSASWSIALPSNKDLNIVGATVVTCSGEPGTANYTCSAGATTTTITGSPAFTINLGASHTLSGFVLTGGSGERISSSGEQNVNKHFRIHHNVLNSTAGWQPIRFHGESNGVHPQGIWDHNRIQNGVAIHTNGTLDQLDESDAQHIIWNENTPLGDSDKVIYVEANYFVTSSGTTNFGDGNYGGRSVIRFNTTDGPAITAWEYHSPQGGNRGYQRWENYNNHHINLDSANTCFFGMHSLRGGTGVVFNNAMTGAVAGCNNSFSLDNVRSEDNVEEAGACDGNSPWDQNLAGSSGWHCRDQIGLARDLSRWNNSPVLAWNQELKPAYIWGNTRAGSVITGTVAGGGLNRTHIQEGRDYFDNSTATGASQTTGVRSGPLANRPPTCTTGVGYWATDEGEWNSSNGNAPDGRLYKCTASSVWTAYYTPFTFPHPWTVGGTIVRPYPPTALSAN